MDTVSSYLRVRAASACAPSGAALKAKRVAPAVRPVAPAALPSAFKAACVLRSRVVRQQVALRISVTAEAVTEAETAPKKAPAAKKGAQGPGELKRVGARVPGRGNPNRRRRGGKGKNNGGVPEPMITLNSILEESPGSTDDPNTLRRINKAIKQTRSLPAALKLVEDMAAANIKPNEQTYVSLMLVCRKQRQAERALVVYEAMKAAGVTPSLLTFNLLLRCTEQSRRREDAMRIKEEMDKFGVQADASSYTIMIETVANAGNFRGRKPPSKRVLEAFELYEEMKERGIAPTTDTYNTLIDGCAQAQQVDQAMAVYLEMVNSEVRPDQTTFMLMMRCAGNSGRLQHALAVFGEMKAAGVQANRDIYNHLIVACGNAPQPQVERAFEFFYEMQAAEGEKIVPDEVTFNALISAACKGGLPSYAFDAFDMMKTLNIRASLRTYNELIHAAGMRGIEGVEAAFEVYDTMRLTGEVPDTITFSSLIAACARARDADRALQVFDEMLEVDCQPNLVVYHALISALGRTGRYQDALDIFHKELMGPETSEYCQPTKATLSILFDACLGPDGAEAALAAAGGTHGNLRALNTEGAQAAKQLYRESVEAGLMQGVLVEASTDASVRADIRQHTRSGAIVGILCLLDDLRAKYGADSGATIGELVVMTGGRVRTSAAGPGRPSKLNLIALAMLDVTGIRCKPLSTLTVQALVVDKAAMQAWLQSSPTVEVVSAESSTVPASS